MSAKHVWHSSDYDRPISSSVKRPNSSAETAECGDQVGTGQVHLERDPQLHDGRSGWKKWVSGQEGAQHGSPLDNLTAGKRSIAITTSYELDYRGIGVYYPRWQRYFSSPQHSGGQRWLLSLLPRGKWDIGRRRSSDRGSKLSPSLHLWILVMWCFRHLYNEVPFMI